MLMRVPAASGAAEGVVISEFMAANNADALPAAGRTTLADIAARPTNQIALSL